MKGKCERDVTYTPVLDELNDIYKDVPMEERGEIRVLVPGAGLGRLAFDIANAGTNHSKKKVYILVQLN
jgi:carnosine N-methyltransferase